MARGGFLISLWCGQGPEGTSGPGSSAYKHQRRLVVLYTTRGIIYYTWYIIPTTPPGWLRDHPWGLSDQPLVRAGTGGYQWARIKRLEAPAAPCSIIYYTWYYIPQKSLLYYISSYPLPCSDILSTVVVHPNYSIMPQLAAELLHLFSGFWYHSDASFLKPRCTALRAKRSNSSPYATLIYE